MLSSNYVIHLNHVPSQSSIYISKWADSSTAFTGSAWFARSGSRSFSSLGIRSFTARLMYCYSDRAACVYSGAVEVCYACCCSSCLWSEATRPHFSINPCSSLASNKAEDLTSNSVSSCIRPSMEELHRTYRTSSRSMVQFLDVQHFVPPVIMILFCSHRIVNLAIEHFHWLVLVRGTLNQLN